jgi:hypothetical protein
LVCWSNRSSPSRAASSATGRASPEPKEGDHGLVVFAINGTPEVRDELDRIMKEFYPDKGFDAGGRPGASQRPGIVNEQYLIGTHEFITE